jgi:hypothetical protein
MDAGCIATQRAIARLAEKTVAHLSLSPYETPKE